MRRVRRKGTNKEKVFGCDLLEHLNASSQEVPLVLRCCSEFVETHGIVDGIYRLSGVSSNIQKLRTDFENDGTPDLNKDVYLQDIHCVSSLCKAYFRELPNPLLTYQLYDKFAEAVAIQLEEERLIKIRDVLKELPAPHYRTLEYLMRHLVRMASYSSETNMHARNLAIVWAPNLLRSKDIEASGFNGTAVFKEVRVQSIVVEFILTHVPQLFPEQDGSQERRKSLPSPSTESNEGPFNFPHSSSALHFGNISPGDAPIPMRPYHAIIEGSDKRKGSLKGRKWMSIFNIGSRFHDPLRRNKHSAKEKDRNVLRPARSMDSLSTPSYPNEGSRCTSQHTPNKSVTPSTQPGLDANAFPGAVGGSEYAVTYRRGTGVVSGNTGNQGTSTALEHEGSTNQESFQARSQGDSAKLSRRAAMHITGPTLVTVPLHITTNLAFGVLQRGGGDRIIHYGRDKGGKGKVPDKEKAEEVEIKDEEEHKNDKEVLMDRTEDTGACGGIEGESEEDTENQEKQEQCEYKPAMGMADVSGEQPKILSTNVEEGKENIMDNRDNDEDNEYMVMKSTDCAEFEPVVSQHEEVASNISDSPSLTEGEEDDLTLSGYVENSFEFLDHMDCSILDHMDCSVPYQVHEFSVEPPGHSDDEYEVMEQNHSSDQTDELQTPMQLIPEAETKSHKLLSIDTHSWHMKSLSLPYMTSPVDGPEEFHCDDDDEDDGDDEDDDGDDYSSEDEENMYVKSLPCDFFLKELTGRGRENETEDKRALKIHPVHVVQVPEDVGVGRSTSMESAGDQKEVDINIKDTEVYDTWEEHELSRTEDKDTTPQEQYHLENKRQSTAADSSSIVEDPQSNSNKLRPLSAEASPHCCSNYPESSVEGSSVVADAAVSERGEVVDYTCSDSPDGLDSESGEGLFEEAEHISEGASEPDDTEEMYRCKDTEDTIEDVVLKTGENDDRMWNIVSDIKQREESNKESGDMLDGDFTGEITSVQSEMKSAVQSDVEVMEVKTAELNFSDAETSEREVQLEAVKEPHGRPTDPELQLEAGEKRVVLGKREARDTIPWKCVSAEDRWSQDRGEVFSPDNEMIESDSGPRAVGRKLVVSKHPKVHQVKAVPVVPPKPQHCRITALTLRQQQQQQQQQHRDRADSDRKETPMKVAMQQDDVCEGDHEGEGDKGVREKEKPKLRGGEREGGVDVSRNSPLSMCFDEAVAIATMRREKEKERSGSGEMKCNEFGC